MKRNLWLRVYDIIQPYRGKLILSMFSLLLTGLGLLLPIWGSKLVGLALLQGDRNLFLECRSGFSCPARSYKPGIFCLLLSNAHFGGTTRIRSAPPYA